MLKKLLPILCLLTLISCHKMQNDAIQIIPAPVKIEMDHGYFQFNRSTKIQCSNNSDDLRFLAENCISLIRPAMSLPLTLDQNLRSKNVILFNLCDSSSNLGPSDYILEIKKNKIELKASTTTSLLYAFQTLRQTLTPDIHAKSEQDKKWKIPCMRIEDSPRFAWRGLQIDVARHFMSTDLLKRYIDILSFYKMNILHLHLSNDQGWRIEIKKYPQLTKKSAWRIEKDGTIYGGFYTQEDIKELIKYADERHIQIIPEIEMPGHTTALLAAFPELSCFNDTLAVSNSWGIHKNTICPAKEYSYQVIENILSEIIDLFPSKYIHLGGDEIFYEQWDKCPLCQEKMKQLHISTTNQFQSYFFKRIESFLSKHNKTMIGREEILRGGLPDNALMQVWKNKKTAVSGSFINHDIIVSMYYDSYFHRTVYQTPLHTVYDVDLIPHNIIPGKESFIKGGECCIWTEYIHEDNIDQHVFPRLIAYAEALWTHKNNKDFIRFYRSLKNHEKRLAYSDIKFGPEAKPIDIESNFDPNLKKCFVKLIPEHKDITIHYCYTQKTPSYYSNSYERALIFNDKGQLTARAFVGTLPYGDILHWKHLGHLAIGKAASLKNAYHRKYHAGGSYALTDGIIGSENYLDGAWQGFKSVDLNAIIDLGSQKNIHSISTRFLHNTNVWIFIPQKVEFLVSQDGFTFTRLALLESQTPDQFNQVTTEDFKLENINTKARYIKVIAKNRNKCPAWHPSGGNHAWLFADEIVVR